MFVCQRTLNCHLLVLSAGFLLGLLSTAETRAQFLEGDVVVLRTFTGEAANDEFGWVTDPVRDLDGDGVDDLLITARGNDEGGPNAGKVYVYSGRTGAEIFTFTGGPGERAGVSVADAGDVNHDGVTDVIAGAPVGGTGRAYIYSGANGALIRMVCGEATGDRYGVSVGSVGDVNNDGYADVIIGATAYNSNTGRVYVISGIDGSVLRTIDGEAVGDRFGSALNGLGDLSGDGIDDFVVGAQNAGVASRGRAYVYSGATGQLLFAPLEPDATGLNFGLFFVASPGDVNDDGVPDVYVGDFSDGNGRGKAYIFDGRNGTRIHVIAGSGPGEGFGIGRGAGDVNQDGYDDLMLAAWSSSSGAPTAGKAQIFSGRDAALLRTITSTTAGETFGFDAHGVADVNADGVADILVSAAWNGSAGFRAGRVYLIAGKRPPLLGDLNCDDAVNAFDIEPFLLALFEPDEYEIRFPNCDINLADINDDGSVDAFDIEPFIQILFP